MSGVMAGTQAAAGPPAGPVLSCSGFVQRRLRLTHLRKAPHPHPHLRFLWVCTVQLPGRKNLSHGKAAAALCGFLKLLPMFSIAMPGMIRPGPSQR